MDLGSDDVKHEIKEDDDTSDNETQIDKANKSKKELESLKISSLDIPTPSVYLDNKKDAFSNQLQDFCSQHPITVVRGIGSALKLDLGLFSTKCLQDEQPNHKVEIKTQQKQSSDESWDAMNMK